MSSSVCCYAKKIKNGTRIPAFIAILLLFPAILRAANDPKCPETITFDKCLCYVLQDGIYLDCHDTNPKEIKYILLHVKDIYSLSVIGLDESTEALGPKLIPSGTCIKHLQVSQTSLRNILDDGLTQLKKCLETLSIVESKIKLFPYKALSGLNNLISVDFASNDIEELPSYSFYGLPLLKLNLKGNKIRDVSENAFATLDLTLSELDLSENDLVAFPLNAISELKHLRTLRIAWNDITTISHTNATVLISLEFLELNFNNFEFIPKDCLRFCPSLKTLTFHFNLINNIHFQAFTPLIHLETLDISRNRIKFLSPNIFQNNANLKSIDLSFNHLHNIHGLFCNLPALSEIYLSQNNILDVPIDAFYNSSNVTKLYLDKNSISNIISESFYNLVNLSLLHLQFNFLNKVPQDMFLNKSNLVILRLDNNLFTTLGNNTFKILRSVKEIKLNRNKLNYISNQLFMNNLELEEIYLENNNIALIEPGSFVKLTKLRHLSLENNHLIYLNEMLAKMLSSLTSLYLNSNYISGIDNLIFQTQTYLQKLWLQNNNLKHISVNLLKNGALIEYLLLNNNNIIIIEDFAFKHTNAVKYLDLSHNCLHNITAYTFFGLRELEEFNLAYNKITFMHPKPFDSLKKLRSLNISFNPLKLLKSDLFQKNLPISILSVESCDIELIENGTFHGLNNLKSLSLKNNSLKFSDLMLIDIPGLKILTMSYNILDYLQVNSFAHLPLLEVLQLEHCNIEYIAQGAFSINKYIVKINLAQNLISMIPDNIFNSLLSIFEFNISNNFLDYVPYNAFYNFTHLEVLDIADNLLPRFEISGLERLKKLKHLVLRKNELKYLSIRKKVEFRELATLDVSYNHLEIVPPNILSIFPNLQNLNISHNDIMKIDFVLTQCKNSNFLITLDISKNPVTSWSLHNKETRNTIASNIYELHINHVNMSFLEENIFFHFVNLQHLTLKYNKIRRFSISPFASLGFLESLDISFNKILQLKTSYFRGLSKLEYLCLSDNYIESVEPFAEELRNVKLLDLSNNKIQNILNEDLASLMELTVLNLSHNNIKYVSATAFRNLYKINQVDLSDNKLKTISTELLNSIEIQVARIVLKNNVLVCNCEKDNSWLWIQDHPQIVTNTVTCVNNDYPKEKCNVPIISQVSVDKHKDNSVSISWLIRNRTSIKALQLLYYGERVNTKVITKYIEINEVSSHIDNLIPETEYVVCIIALYEDPIQFQELIQIPRRNDSNENGTYTKPAQEIAESILMRHPTSECVSFDTYKNLVVVKLKSNRISNLSSILNRRLGLMVGCGLGFIVFFIMVSILLYTKFQERKRIAKSDPAWSEMNEYKSTQSKEDVNSTAASTDNILLGMTKNRNYSLK